MEAQTLSFLIKRHVDPRVCPATAVEVYVNMCGFPFDKVISLGLWTHLMEFIPVSFESAEPSSATFVVNWSDIGFCGRERHLKQLTKRLHNYSKLSV